MADSRLRSESLVRLTSVRVAFETARLRLAQIHSESHESRQNACRLACKHSATTLGVGRVSVWLLSEDGETLRCESAYLLDGDRYVSGEILERRDHPEYFQAITDRRVLVASDALEDPKTRSLRDYLLANRVQAVLDAPIYRDGGVVGVVCHEQIGESRAWTEADAGFASAVADMLTILSEQAERAELRAALDEQRYLEVQHQKMQALAQLGRVVIHDLSNVMTIVSARAALLSGEQDVKAASEELADALHYGNSLLQKLRNFYNDKVPDSQVEVRSLLEGLEPSLRALLGKTIDFRFNSEIPPTRLTISEVEFEQMILNLCVNAKDAVEPHGRIELNVRRQADLLLIDVTDDGRGMDEETQARLFEPFFSTKAGHNGIGLAAVYGIVARAAGRIEVSSQLRLGTTFHIRLPLTFGDELAAPWDF